MQGCLPWFWNIWSMIINNLNRIHNISIWSRISRMPYCTFWKIYSKNNLQLPTIIKLKPHNLIKLKRLTTIICDSSEKLIAVVKINNRKIINTKLIILIIVSILIKLLYNYCTIINSCRWTRLLWLLINRFINRTRMSISNPLQYVYILKHKNTLTK